MRITVSNRLALVAALGVVASTIGAYGLRPSATPTFASQPPLTAGDFQQVALQGFGDRMNSEAWSMEWFNNKLYVGDNRNYACAKGVMYNQIPIIGPLFWPYPPKDPDVVCPGSPPRPQDLPPTEAAEIWALDPTSATGPLTQSNWTEVYQDPYTVTMTMNHTNVMTARDIGWRGMSTFNDPEGTTSLYVSGVGSRQFAGKNAPPPALMRLTNGSTTFQPVPADPGTTMGDINQLTTVHSLLGTGACCFRGSTTYKGVFYILVTSIQGGGAVFASPDPAKGDNTFQQITPPSMQAYEIESFNGHLYIALQSTNNGYTVVRTDCTAPPPGQVGCPASDFTQVLPDGAGLGSKGNCCVTSMKVYTDTNGIPHLYVGSDGAPNQTPAEIVRINQDDSWDLIVGNPRSAKGHYYSPLSGLDSGFGWYYNWHMWRMEVYNGVLYVGTFNDATFNKNQPGAQNLQPWMGFWLFASPDGVTFMPVTTNGFGDMFSYGARTMKGTPYGLFVGSANQYYGLRVWQGQATQNAVNNAPRNTQGDTASGNGTAAISWDASNGATLYHVYRSTATRVRLAPPVNGEADPNSMHVRSARPSHFWLPVSYTEIGTTTSPYFVDHSVQSGKRYSYYVVAQYADGSLSMKSNVATVPSLLPLPTFRSIRSMITTLAAHHALSSEQASTLKKALKAAKARLNAGDAQGCRDQLEALRHELLFGSQAQAGRSSTEVLALMIGRLEKRVALVNVHVVSAAHVG